MLSGNRMHARRVLVWVAAALLSIHTTFAFAETITGDPAADPGWIGGTANSLGFGTYASGSEQDSVNIYTTAFDLSASSQLDGLAGPDSSTWQIGDVIVGVGGLVVPTTAAAGGWNAYLSPLHTVNQQINDGSQRIVVKYGTSTATWSTSTTAPDPGNGNVALASGGIGAVLLGTGSTTAETQSTDSGILVVTDDSPEIVTGSGTSGIDGSIGREVEDWNGSTLVGFESFLDLTLLNTQDSDTSVSLGSVFDLDMQDGTGNFTNSQGTLPTTLTVSAVPLPRISWTFLILIGSVTGFRGLQRLRAVPIVCNPHTNRGICRSSAELN